MNRPKIVLGRNILANQGHGDCVCIGAAGQTGFAVTN